MREAALLSSSATRTHDGQGTENVGVCLLLSCASGVSVLELPAGDALVLGRGEDAAVVIPDRSVSRRHAVLRLKDSMTVEDLGSRNGTRVQGVGVRRGERAPVAVGTVLELGDATLVLQRARPELPRNATTEAPKGVHPEKLSELGHPPQFVEDPTMRRLYALLDIIAPTPLPVLILGETGVGKEVFASSVHARSARRERSMLTINCAALPESILEGELFGYEKGAFTGATQSRPGLFEAAHGGSIFLDEVGELPLASQAKLLRVLENGEVVRLGGRRPTKVDVRFIAATNRDLRSLVANGDFRADLYFRLDGMTVTLPPLRARKADLRRLATEFLQSAARKLGREPPILDDHTARALEAHPWPGNIRELRMVMERAAAFCSGPRLTRRHLDDVWGPLDLGEGQGHLDAPVPPAPVQTAAMKEESQRPPAPPVGAAGPFRDAARELERQRILEALEQCGGNQTRAAVMVGIPRRTFVKRLDAYGIVRPRKALTDSRSRS
jgi:transcriptional regulator with GAF, ATPase, and Fis domain